MVECKAVRMDLILLILAFLAGFWVVHWRMCSTDHGKKGFREILVFASVLIGKIRGRRC